MPPPPGNLKRKLTEADGSAIVAARLRKDMSALFALPTVPLDAALAPQPAAFRGALYPYQRRSLARMLEIESGASITIQIGHNHHTYVPKGGVVADTVGMGKTAQLIALLLARPATEDHWGSTIAALVLTPDHLCHQWRTEIAKFAGEPRHRAQRPKRAPTAGCPGAAGDALDVVIATNAEEVQALSPSAWCGRGGTARVLVASLEQVCASAEFEEQLVLARARHFDRLILDECHDAVLLDGGRSMTTLLRLQSAARRVWCVTGTPFPEGDRSVFGLHQLLGVNVKFVLSNSPFLKADTPLPPTHAFEQLKRLVYLRNTPASVGDEVAGSRLVEEAPHVIEVFRLRFRPVERGFYDEAARRANAESGFGDSFSARFDPLRRLCCHPATHAGWAARLAGAHGAHGGGAGGGAVEVVSLDEMRARMVQWKADEIRQARAARENAVRAAAGARAACTLVLEALPSLYDAHGAERAREPRPAVGMWRCVDYWGNRGAYHEERLSRARLWASRLPLECGRQFLQTTHAWLAPPRVQTAAFAVAALLGRRSTGGSRWRSRLLPTLQRTHRATGPASHGASAVVTPGRTRRRPRSPPPRRTTRRRSRRAPTT